MKGRLLRLSVALGLAALMAGSPAPGDDHPGGHQGGTIEGNPFYKYPDGAATIAQSSRKPPVGAAGMAVEALLPRPAGLDAGDVESLVPLLRSSARQQIGSIAGFAGDVAKHEVVLSYGLVFKGVPLSRETSQNVVLHETPGQRDPILISQRNVPAGGELNGLPIDEARKRLEGQVLTSLEKVGLELTRKSYAQADPDANVFIERRLEPPHLEIRKLKGQPARLVWTYVVASDSLRLPLRRRFYVPTDAAGAQAQADFIDLLYGFDDAVSGSVKGKCWSIHCSGFSPAPNTESAGLGGLTVTRGSQSVVTDQAGNYQFPGAGTGTTQVALAGPNCRIINLAGPLLGATRSGSQPLDFNFNASDDLQLAQVSAFRYVNRVADFTRSVLTSPDLPNNSRPNLLANLETYVNTNDTCNAFWDGSSLNFFVSGRCRFANGMLSTDVGVNTAYSDVIFHEYGHGVDDALGGIQDGGYSEGFGDSVAMLLLRDHVIGPGWKRRANGTVANLRDGKNTVQWQDVMGAEVHTQGTAYGGFVWSLVEALGGGDRFDVAKQLIFGAALRDPTSIPDAVIKSFLFDYEIGGDHFEPLKQAAKAHGLPYPKDRNALADPSTLNDHLLSKGDPNY